MSEKKSASILVIDDDETVLISICAYLADCGYFVMEAENGRIGLEVFRKEKPDVVLVDLRMPEMDGKEVLLTITRESPNTPVIIISGTGVVADAIETLRLGAWDYILKPITDMTLLDHVIQKSIDQVRLREEKDRYQRHLEESLRKIHEDEEAGRKIQRKLLPPKHSDLNGYIITRNVMSSLYLSGDFMDYFQVNPECFAFYTADVSGHGISSALITVFLKSFMRKYLEKYQQEESDALLHPDQLLKNLNFELIRENLEKHVAIFYSLVNVPENTLCFANGGQFPYPMLWSDGSCELIEAKGAPAGLFPFTEYVSHKRQLSDKFFMAIFSDGVLDVLPQEGVDAKVNYLKSLGSPDRVQEAVSNWKKDRNHPDDITVLTLRREGDDLQ